MSWFEYFMGVIILFNMVVVIAETDYLAKNPNAPPLPWTDKTGWLILSGFVIEMALRLYCFRIAFWKDQWNVFDFVVVLVDTLFSLLGFVFGRIFPASVLRVFRLCKLARVLKVFRVFAELRSLMAGIAGSVRAIFWGTVLLAFVLLMWSIVGVEYIHPLNDRLDYGDCDRCSRAYSTVFQTTLTFAQTIITGDSWGQTSIPLIEAYPVTTLYFIGVYVTVGMGTMNLILGVVVNVASQAHDNLKLEMDELAKIARMENHGHLMEMCIEMDNDGDGELSKPELLTGFETNESFRKAFDDMGIQEEDLEVVWTILDADKSGQVTFTEFIREIYKLKDSDQQFMLAYIKYYIKDIQKTIREDFLSVAKEEETLMQKLASEEEHMLEELQNEQSANTEELKQLITAKNEKSQSTPLPVSPKNAPKDLSPKALQPALQNGTPQKLVLPQNLCSMDVSSKDVAPKVCDQACDGKVDLLFECEARQFQKDMRESIRDLRRRVDLYASNTSQLLLEVLPDSLLHQEGHVDLMALPNIKTSARETMDSLPSRRYGDNGPLLTRPDWTWDTPKQPSMQDVGR
jgi:voltage-gated sodium channel